MKSLLIKIFFSFLLLFCLNLFLQNSTMAQFPGGSSQRGPSLTQQLEEFSLPEGPMTESDIPSIKTVIQQVLNKISENKKSTGQNKADVQPIISGILVFKDWLMKQGCVNEVSVSYVEDSGEYSESIFISYPGQVPMNIFFNTDKEKTEEYRLLVFVSTTDVLKFASIIKNTN